MPRKSLSNPPSDDASIRVAGKISGRDYKDLIAWMRQTIDKRTGKPVKMDTFITGIVMTKIRAIQEGRNVKW